MSLLPRLRIGKDRAAEAHKEALEQRISNLQVALQQCGEVARRVKEFRRETTAAIAVIALLIGFALGVYRESIQHSALALAQAVGIAGSGLSTNDPYVAFDKNDFRTALRLALPLAQQGDAKAQALVGLINYRGSRDMPRDLNEAANWFRRAAEQGNASGQFYLGTMCYQGQGVPQDYAEAAKWYRLAAEQGDPEAQYSLGVMYARGEAGQTDQVQAYMWLNLAAARFPASDTRRRTATDSRELLATKMTPEQLSQAQKLSRDWKPRS
jgi:TPR repeat protein